MSSGITADEKEFFKKNFNHQTFKDLISVNFIDFIKLNDTEKEAIMKTYNSKFTKKNTENAANTDTDDDFAKFVKNTNEYTRCCYFKEI